MSAVPDAPTGASAPGPTARPTPVPRRAGFSARRLWAVLGLLALGLLGVAALSLWLGVERLDFARVLEPASRDNPHPDLLRVRLPRVIEGAAVGAALAAVGVAFQSLLRNPLADPYVLGVSGGATLGATVVIVAGQAFGAWAGIGISEAGHLGLYLRQLFGFAGAVGATALIYGLARVRGRASTYSMILAGVVFNATSSALILFAEYLVAPQRSQEILVFISGHLSSSDPPLVLATLGVGVLVGVLLLARDTGYMNVLATGEETAQSLGVDVVGLRRRLFLVSSLLVGLAVSVVGLIGFVGMIVPHALRLVLGPDHRVLLPASALLGATFLLAADLLARALFPVFHGTPPVGVITALVGGPLFLWLMHRQRQLHDW